VYKALAYGKAMPNSKSLEKKNHPKFSFSPPFLQKLAFVISKEESNLSNRFIGINKTLFRLQYL
jgi:hypothetical protein